MTVVHAHDRHTHTGQVVQVHEHQRSVDKHALVAALAKHMHGPLPSPESLHAAVERAIAQHHDAQRVKHVRHEGGEWRTSNTKPQAQAGQPLMHVGSGKLKISVGGAVVHELPLIPAASDEPVLVQKAEPKEPGFAIPPAPVEVKDPTPPAPAAKNPKPAPAEKPVPVAPIAEVPAPSAIAKEKAPKKEKTMRVNQALWRLQDKVAQAIGQWRNATPDDIKRNAAYPPSAEYPDGRVYDGYLMDEATGLQHRHAALKEAMGMPRMLGGGNHTGMDYGHRQVTEPELARAMEIYKAKVEAIVVANVVHRPADRKAAKPILDPSTVFTREAHRYAFAAAIADALGGAVRDAVTHRDVNIAGSGKGWDAHFIMKKMQPNGFAHESYDLVQNDRHGATLKEWATGKVIWRDKTATTPGTAMEAIAAAMVALKQHMGITPPEPTPPSADPTPPKKKRADPGLGPVVARDGAKPGDVGLTAKQVDRMPIPVEPVEHPIEASDEAQHPFEGDATSQERWVPTFRVPSLQAKVAELNKKARKLGMKPLELSTGEGKIIKRAIQVDFIFPGPGAPGGPVYEDRAIHHTFVRITGESPQINGWTPLGKVEHNEGKDGKPVNVLHSFGDKPLPAGFIFKENGCDHCKKARERNATFILKKGKVVKQVGKSCLKDFTGHANPEQLMNRANFLDDMYRDFFDAEDEGLGRMKRMGEGYDPETFLTHTAQVVIDHGWVSKAAAEAHNSDRSKQPISPTVDLVRDRLDRMARASSLETPADYGPVTSHAKELAKQAIAWTQGLVTKKGASDYELKLGSTASLAVAENHHQGILASAIGAYQRHAEGVKAKKLAAETSGRGESKHVGAVGDKHEFEGTLERVIPFETDWGSGQLYKFVDKEGNHITWPASRNQYAITGNTYQVKGTIKGHRDYRGTPETTITRGGIMGLAETDEARDARVAKAIAKPPALAAQIAKHVDPALRGTAAVVAIQKAIGFHHSTQGTVAPIQLDEQTRLDVGRSIAGLVDRGAPSYTSDLPRGGRLRAAIEQLTPAQLVHAAAIFHDGVAPHAKDGTISDDVYGGWLGHHGVAIVEKLAGIAPHVEKPARKRKEKAA